MGVCARGGIQNLINHYFGYQIRILRGRFTPRGFPLEQVFHCRGLAADAADPEISDARDAEFGDLMRPRRVPDGDWIGAETAAERGSDWEAMQLPMDV